MPLHSDPQTHVMHYIKANASIPFSVETSTARKGRKWFDLVNVGDTLDFHYTEDDTLFGRARVTSKELLTFAQVIERAGENHAGGNLVADLDACYGPSQPGDEFTMVKFIRTTEV